MTEQKKTIEDLIAITAQLRDKQKGCPWDLEQNFQTIACYTLEEAYEVVEAIEDEDYVGLKDELGDLLFQVMIYSQMGKENGYFEFEDVVHAISSKMLRRHPHVFGGQNDISIDEIEANWKRIKAEEKAARGEIETSCLDGISKNLPALTRALFIQKKAAGTGFDWPGIPPILDKLDEEIAEYKEAALKGDAAHIEDEIGDLFFTIVNLARHHDIDPETALRKANRKFEGRFRLIEKEVSPQDDLEALEAKWQEAKKKWA